MKMLPGQADMAVSSSVGSNIFDILASWMNDRSDRHWCIEIIEGLFQTCNWWVHMGSWWAGSHNYMHKWSQVSWMLLRCHQVGLPVPWLIKHAIESGNNFIGVPIRSLGCIWHRVTVRSPCHNRETCWHAWHMHKCQGLRTWCSTHASSWEWCLEPWSASCWVDGSWTSSLVVAWLSSMSSSSSPACSLKNFSLLAWRPMTRSALLVSADYQKQWITMGWLLSAVRAFNWAFTILYRPRAGSQVEALVTSL